MPTDHTIYLEDARFLDNIEKNSVELVVTAPPNPMEELWDGLFEELNIEIADAFVDGDFVKAYELMHTELKKVWSELKRVLVPGGIVCLVTSDVFRQFNGTERCFRNQSKITENMKDCGFTPLPSIIWDSSIYSQPTYIGAKVSPPMCYPSVETQQIQIFRNGPERDEINEAYQKKSNFFCGEKEKWFKPVWQNLKSVSLTETQDEIEVTPADSSYPFELPYRLINMFSIYDDTVLDPFLGTGTTMLAAITSRRNSIGYEIDETLFDKFEQELRIVPSLSRKVVKERLNAQRERLAETDGEVLESEQYNIPVEIEAEKDIKFYVAESLKKEQQNKTISYRISHKGF